MSEISHKPFGICRRFQSKCNWDPQTHPRVCCVDEEPAVVPSGSGGPRGSWLLSAGTAGQGGMRTSPGDNGGARTSI